MKHDPPSVAIVISILGGKNSINALTGDIGVG